MKRIGAAAAVALHGRVKLRERWSAHLRATSHNVECMADTSAVSQAVATSDSSELGAMPHGNQWRAPARGQGMIQNIIARVVPYRGQPASL